MSAKAYDQIQTLVDIQDDLNTQIIPRGTLGTIVECYEQPEGYAVDLATPHEDLVGGFQYANVILTPEQFTIVKSSSETSSQPIPH
ncbi:hypothetical protein H6F43_15815 [Leptolyngbya sp. FACHB-36]|uniref:hypothetical protein n=1 Tax=Leptolyngbya sp. FACHB-36 TaxID=2692808 RepID=UPI0016818DD8|nr:hypothetical protein [Leptolyngbya sp. FACHB-36]MBD2021647.1 hypothetical protein [Leptolyngbya sp. FACHB-36]